MNIYRITNWEAHFETCETKKLTYLKWVPVPNKHDGLGFRQVAAQKNCCELYAAWQLILQVASKGRRGEDRGFLRRQGRPLNAQDLSLMTGFPVSIFEKALIFFSSTEIGWLSNDVIAQTSDNKQPPVLSGEPPDLSGSSPAEGKEGKEGNGRRVGRLSSQQCDDNWIAEISSDPAYVEIDVFRESHKCNRWCVENRKPMTRRRLVNWLNRVEKPMKVNGDHHTGPNI